MFNKLLLSSILNLFILFFCFNAYSADGYIKAAYGVTSQKIDTGDSTHGTDITEDFDDEGYEIVIGLMVSEKIASEISYVYLGEGTIKTDNNDQFKINGVNIDTTGSETIKREVDGFGIGIAALLGGEKGGLNFRAGALGWEATGDKAAKTSHNAFVNSVLFADGIDPYVGIDVNFKPIGSIIISAGYTSYGLDMFDQDISLASAGLGWSF